MTILRRPFLLVLALYLLLALGYGIVNPLFESPDEHWHYFTVQEIADTGRLPSVGAQPDPWLAQEAAQPPLYYVLAALLVRPFDTGQARDLVWPNPRVQLGDASAPMNTNAFVHGPAEEWPWHGYVLAAHFLRAFASLLGLGTLYGIYRSGLLFWPDAPDRALLATAMVAFLPQFNFIHGSVGNDPMIILLSTIVLWQLLRLWRHGLAPGRLLILGLTVGLAILSKMAGLLLLAYAVIFITAIVLRRFRGLGTAAIARTWLRSLLLLLGPALLVSGWLLWRNWSLYGDVTATNQFVRIAGGDRRFSLPEVIAETGGLWTSLFAVFGWFNIRAPGWVYFVWNGIVFGSLLGAVRQLWRRGTVVDRRESVLDHPWLLPSLLALWLVLLYAGLVRFLLKTPAAQGRLLFPALVPLALALAYGLSRLLGRRLFWLPPGMALATTLFSLFFVVPAAYAKPQPLVQWSVPAAATELNAQMGLGLELLAAEIDSQASSPGDWLWFTLYWHRDGTALNDRAVQEAPEYVLELFGRDDRLVGKAQSHHGGGLYPATLWEPGLVVADRVAVRLDDDTAVPTAVQPFIRLVEEQRSVSLGTIKVAPTTWPAAVQAPLAELQEVELASVALGTAVASRGESVIVHVTWQVRTAPGRDWTTFVHLGDPSQPPLAQGDSQPLEGYYPTRLWAAGEVIEDSYALPIPADLPAGRYPVHVGLYDPASGLRVPLVAGGQRQSSDAYLVGWLTVTES